MDEIELLDDDSSSAIITEHQKMEVCTVKSV